MIDSDFDRKLRSKLESHTEQVDSYVWEGIEGRLNRIKRMKVMRRVSFYTVAAAACLLVGIFVFRGGEETVDLNLTKIAQVSQETSVNEIKPMAEQIREIESKTADLVSPVQISKESEEEGGIPVIAVQKETKKETEQETEEKVVKESEVKVEVKKEVQKDGKKELDKYSSLSDWEESVSVNTKRHTSLLAISSNISSIASENSFILDLGPAHTSSQTGEVAGSGIIPVSESVYSIPVSFGLQFKTAISRNFYIGSGLTYTFLHSRYDAIINKELFQGLSSQLHYIGIPVNFYYNFLNSNKVNAYANGGGMVEKCILSRYVYGSNASTDKVTGLQYSANLGVGIEYWFIKRMGIYFDPSFVYYFDNTQPNSIRTAQPLQMRFEVGFRFSL